MTKPKRTPKVATLESVATELAKWESPAAYLDSHPEHADFVKKIMEDRSQKRCQSAKQTSKPSTPAKQSPTTATDGAGSSKQLPSRKSDTAPKNETAEEKARRLLVFYDTRDASYWIKSAGNYVTMSKSDMQDDFRQMGIPDTVYIGPLDLHSWIFWNARAHRQVIYTGALAGHKVGEYINSAGERLLVTTQAVGVFDDFRKDEKAPTFFPAYIKEFLPHEQWQYLCYWAAHALKEMRRGTLGPGQAVFIAGEPESGKSLLQEMVVKIFGGRIADPMKFLADKTSFNGDLAKAESWMIEDPKTSFDSRTRGEFGDNIKNYVITRRFAIHPKGKEQISVLILRRFISTLNIEKIALVPPLDRDFAEKTFVLKSTRVVDAFKPFMNRGQMALIDDNDPGELDTGLLWAKFDEELPRLRAWLLNKFSDVPVEMRDRRFGVTAFQHPELLIKVSELSRENHLLQLIDRLLWPKITPADEKAGSIQSIMPWEGLSFDLHQRFQESNLREAYASICRDFQQTGTFLGKLERDRTLNRISRLPKQDGYLPWKIVPPSTTKPTE